MGRGETRNGYFDVAPKMLALGLTAFEAHILIEIITIEQIADVLSRPTMVADMLEPPAQLAHELGPVFHRMIDLLVC